MTTPEELDALQQRLLSRDKSRHGYSGHPLYNRDGPEASGAITALRARVAELDAATDQLQYIASANATRAEKAEAGGPLIEYIRADLATPAPVVPADQRAAIEALADRMWRVHPKDIHAAGYEHLERGGKYENPRAAWYADQIEALFKQFRDQVSPVEPAEGLDPERLVMAWMSEMEGFATRGERFMDTITDGNDVAPWLHAACQVGIDAALRSAPPVGARVIAEKAYLAGFNAAGEGYNGEWPFHDKGISPDTDEGWLIGRDMALAALLPAGEGEE